MHVFMHVGHNFSLAGSFCPCHTPVLLKGVDVSVVSRGDSTLRGHFPGDLAALEAGMDGEEHNGIARP